MKIPVQLRYPLPFYSGFLLTLLLGGGGCWYLYDADRLSPWSAVAVIGGALLVGVLVAVALWSKARLLCQWCVVMLPPAWAAHADEVAGAQGKYRAQKSLVRASRLPSIKNGALIVPVSTTSGGLLSGHAQEQAEKLANALQLSAARVEKPKGKKNPGYVLFVLPLEDAAA